MSTETGAGGSFATCLSCGAPVRSDQHEACIRCLPMMDRDGAAPDEALVERVAEALFAYNTAQGDHFVIHNGGYQEIARVAVAALRSVP